VRAEISYDLVMDDEMSFAEGAFRLPGGEWQVFIFSRLNATERPVWRNDQWESGVRGIVVAFPNERALNKAAVMEVLTDATGATEWIEVRGPDSMQLR
jgi:hypothetical protein